MKLFYITRVNIPSKVAQSVQIDSMCKAFNLNLKNFTLISPENGLNTNINKDYKWIKIKIKTRFRYLELVFKSIFRVLKDRPTHIYTRDIVVAFVLSFFNNKVIYEAHKEPKTFVANLLIKYLRNIKKFYLITISEALKNYYLKEYQFSEKRIFSYHDGVFVENYDSLRSLSKQKLREELGLPIDKKIVMHTGSLYPGRGAELFEVIVKEFEFLLFVQVGGSESDILKYRTYYSSYDNIIFIPHQVNKKLIEYQMSADLLFYPMTIKTDTYWCCSPMKMFEFMATGKPILSSNVGSVSEVLSSNNSIPFDPNDKKSIIAGVNIFLNDNNYVNKIADNSLKLIYSKYTWQKRALAIIDFIR